MNNFKMLLFAVMIFTLISCRGDKLPKNKVDIDQLNYDDTNNYNHIFKDKIEEEKRNKGKYKKSDL